MDGLTDREFLRIIRTELEDIPVSSRRAAGAVFEALHQRLSFGQTLGVESHLPEGTRELWMVPGMDRVSRFLGGVIPMNEEEFLERVRVRAGLESRGEAQIAARAVFKALKRQLPADRRREVGEQLPEGLRGLWHSA